MSEASLTLNLEPELHEQFLAEARAAQRPAADIMRELLQTFIARQRHAREHDTWFRAAVMDGIRQADDPAAEFASDEEVMARWDIKKVELLKRAAAE